MSVILRLARSVAALLVIGTVIGGGAWALSRFGRLDALASLSWARLWTTADDGGVVLGVITAIGWIAWALATASLVSELLAAISQQRWRLRFPGLNLFAPASSVLATAIVGLVVGQVVTPAPAFATASTERAPEPAQIAGDPLTADDERAGSKPTEVRSHLVRPGDDLWTLAQHYYQDGSRWREIAAANQSVLLESTDQLEPGTLLAIPQPLSAVNGVVVRPGDTLSDLAAEHLGDTDRWPEIVEANAGRLDDPNTIDVGWVLAMPGSDRPAPSAPGDDAKPVAAFGGEQSVRVSREELATCPVPAEPSITETQPASTAASMAALPCFFGATLAAGLGGAYLLRRRRQSAARPLGRRLPPLPATARPTSGALTAAFEAAPMPAEQAPITRVPLGEGASGPIHCDLEQNALTWLGAADGDDVAVATAIVLALVSNAQEAAITVVVAGPEFGWLTSMDDPCLVVLEGVDDALQLLDEVVGARAESRPQDMTLAQLRADPALAEAWAPFVLVTSSTPGRPLPTDLGLLGVSVVICGGTDAAVLPASTIEIGPQTAEYLPTGEVFEPNLVPAPARRVLAEIFGTANLTEYPSAPWWDETPAAQLPTVLRVAAWPGSVEELPVASTIEPEHPTLKLLGPVELIGARGQLPSRAIKQCEEYCAWLLENPGGSAGTMTRALMVAEPTRRSNMSRLRSWLGSDANGAPYLPDAYTGRIMLHPGVSSDWEQVQLCLSGGVNRVGDAALVEALGMVRGAPMADAAPGQWHWAEQLRADICGTIRDCAVVLGRRAVAVGNFELAQWAVDRAQAAAPDDELLLGVQIQIAHASGDRAQVDRLVLQLTRRARMQGIDLADETVTLLQEVVEGRARLRRA